MTKNEKKAMAKEMTIARILKNNTYSDDSGLFVMLRKALRKMSYADLQALEIIIGCK